MRMVSREKGLHVVTTESSSYRLTSSEGLIWYVNFKIKYRIIASIPCELLIWFVTFHNLRTITMTLPPLEVWVGYSPTFIDESTLSIYLSDHERKFFISNFLLSCQLTLNFTNATALLEEVEHQQKDPQSPG